MVAVSLAEAWKSPQQARQAQWFKQEAVSQSRFPRAGEMAQWLKALAELPDVLSSIPSTHVVAHSHL